MIEPLRSSIDQIPTILLHGDPWLLAGPLWTTWVIDPTVAVGIFALAAAYVLANGRRRRGTAAEVDAATPRQQVLFFAGCLTLLLALGPPLEDWSGLLLSGHMLQHLLLTIVAPPLLLLGTPAWMLRPLLRWPLVARLGYGLTRPLVALVLSGLVLVVWHLPALYDASLRSQLLHVAQHQTFLATAVLAWWPLVGPLPEWPRPAPLGQCLYLFAQTLPGGIVGSFMALAKPGLYPYYAEVPRMWGIDLGVDQQVAGLLMWVGTSTLYLVLTAVVFFGWAAREEAADAALAGSRFRRGGAVGTKETIVG